MGKLCEDCSSTFRIGNGGIARIPAENRLQRRRYSGFRKRPFQLNPINPDCGRDAVPVVTFASIESVAQAFPVRRLPLLDAKFPLRVKADLHSRFNDPWLFNGPVDLVTADRKTCKASWHSVQPLWVSDLDEMTERWRILHDSGANPQDVCAGRKLLWIWRDVDTLDSPGELQICATMTMGELGIVLVVGILPPVSTPIGKGRSVRIFKTELFR